MKVDVIYKDYDENNVFVYFLRDGKNIHHEFGICSFENEMEYWDMPTTSVKYENENGYLFSKSISEDELSMEIQRFIDRYELEKVL